MINDVMMLIYSVRNISYGVKQYEGRNYLFGPGVLEHLEASKGFGQMGILV